MKKRAVDPKAKPSVSKILSATSMKVMQGKSGENPYASGQSKWDVVYKGINVMTGNYTTSGTDLTFEGGYGIPVKVTRTYSANDGDEGPLGKGWTLSVDVRSTVGGLMKSGSAPVRAVPVNFKERPSAQIDPNAVTADGSFLQPIQAVLATDAGGTEETIQRDADGILSTPPWDKNKMASEYETIVNQDGSNTQILTKNWVHTPEGTVYLYEKQGSYTGGGVKPFDDPNATAEPSNILKIKTATDRHGNVTTYTYSTNTWVNFTKMNGTTQERPLTQINMPNGHQINFTWGTGGTANRIISATDGVRTVQYGYTSGLLTSVTTPAGKVTGYEYGNAIVAPKYANLFNGVWDGPTATDLLTEITDPRGLETKIKYIMLASPGIDYKPVAYRIEAPGSHMTEVAPYGHNQLPGGRIDSVTENQGIYHNWGVVVNSYYGPGHVVDYTLVSGSPVVTHDFQVQIGGDNDVKTVQMNNTHIYFHGGDPATTAWTKYYDWQDQNLVRAVNNTFSWSKEVSSSSGINAGRGWGTDKKDYWITDTVMTYNFMGSPLKKETTLTTVFYNQQQPPAPPAPIVSAVQYAYWGADKYYQQKAVKDQAGRYSYTDYYNTSAATGKKGQTYKIYDEKRTVFVENTNIQIPTTVPATPTENYWKYRLEPQTDTYSAKFDYDSKGRSTNVWKIQKTDTNPWTYVQTVTSFGADSSPTWGAATQVVEDYGGINRTTSTTEYDSIGRAIKVQDASGKIFKTNYDLDGVISSIQRLDGGSTNVATYTYGTSGVTNGAVLSVTDNLSGVVQDMTYYTTGASVGQVASVTETNGSDQYSTSYTYNVAGERETATYVTLAAFGLSNTVKWGYTDYASHGVDPARASRVFQTLVRLDPTTGDRTSEEFHYLYDGAGRIRQATFAMSPQSWTPSGGASFYDADHKAATRARVYNNYNVLGQLIQTNNWFDTLSSGSYSSQFVRGNECDYEITGMKRGLKTTSRYTVPVSGQPLNWATQRAETYSYDADLDYLVGADYDDGLTNETVTWSYDAAGNRASDSSNSGTWTYDNLNRMTLSPGYAYSNDILGNRGTRYVGSQVGTGQALSHQWDVLNRMVGMYSSASGNPASSYQYRADGLRVLKGVGSYSQPNFNITTWTRYRYDGQTGIEDVELNSSNSVTAIARHGLGARGIDVTSRTTGSGNTLTYPLYDGLGSCIGQLARNGSSFTVSDERSYDAWGGIRSGGSSDNKSRYVGSIGHKQDDESGLIYMRARYYEPGSGRFVSEDSARDGLNYFAYCWNDPNGKIDVSGRDAIPGTPQAMIGMINAMLYFAGQAAAMGTDASAARVMMMYIKRIERLMRLANVCQQIAMATGEAIVEDSADKGEIGAINAIEGSAAEMGVGVTWGAAKVVAQNAIRQLWQAIELLGGG